MLTNLLIERIKIYLKIILILIVIATLGYVFYLRNEVHNLSNQIDNLETKGILDRKICEYELDLAKVTISKQNIVIEEFRINNSEYEIALHEQEKELIAKKVKAQEDIKKELEMDSSLENQMRLVTGILQEFSNEK